MVLFNKKNNSLEKIKKIDFKLEKEIQKMTEDNLSFIFNLEFIKSEFPIGEHRFDTLAFDKETKSFVIIEYKKDAKHTDVFVQGMAYLNSLLNNISSFIVEYNETLNKNLKRDEIDKTQSRVILVSQNFTEKQKQAIDFKDLPIELWEVNKYEDNIIEYLNVNLNASKISIKETKLIKSENDVLKEVKTYTEEDHLSYASDEIKEFYLKLKERILELDTNVEIKPTKFYIAFKKIRNIISIEIQKYQMKVNINFKNGKIKDPKKMTRDVSNIGTLGSGHYEVLLKKENDNFEDREYLMELIKQSLKVNN